MVRQLPDSGPFSRRISHPWSSVTVKVGVYGYGIIYLVNFGENFWNGMWKYVTIIIMSRDLQRRILRDYKDVKEDKTQSFAVTIDKDNLRKWNAVIFGADQTEWQGAVLRLKVEFPENYPNSPPDMRFEQPIPFHPNVYQNGKICIDILQHNWSSAYNIGSVLRSIQALLVDPNPNSPANNSAAVLFTENRAEYTRVVKKYVETTWSSTTEAAPQ